MFTRFLRGFFTKTRVAIMTIAAVVLGAGIAFAYFTATGSGTGSAQTGSAGSLTIQQIGAGYDSLIAGSGDPYIQDQCFQCAQISELGNDITLAGSGAQQLVSVVVAMRNWSGAVTGLPMTLTISNGIAGPVTDTQDFNFPAAIGPNTPSVTNVTFDFASQGAFVEHQFVYGISFDPSFDSNAASGLNVALSSSSLDLSVGTDTNPGTIYVATKAGAGIAGDFPACSTPGTGFAPVSTDCGPSAPTDPGAYGNVQPTADIPAVEVNVVGGVVPSLYPGGPAQPIGFAITNQGPSTVHVSTVTTSVSGLAHTGSISGAEACTTSMYPIANATVTVNQNVPAGTSIFDATGTSISMTDDGANQDNCEGATVDLSFASS